MAIPARPAPGPARSRLRRALGVGLAVLVLAGLAGIGLFSHRWMAGPTCQATAGERTFAFTPEQLENASIITAVALTRGLPARAATIALATAIQESGLRNLDHGDRDSVGLFQQRPSQGWGSVAEIRDPQYAAGRFYDALVKVEDYANRPITEVAQEVQRSAYPTAYADHEAEGRVLASTLAGHSPAGLGCRLGNIEDRQQRAEVIAGLRSQLGVVGRAEGERDIVVRAGSTQAAWQVAAWAVAQAQTRGVDRVGVDGRYWARSGTDDTRQWYAQEREDADATVRITMG